jgi:cytochrome c553
MRSIVWRSSKEMPVIALFPVRAPRPVALRWLAAALALVSGMATGQDQSASLAAQGAALAEAHCATCHGAAGQSASPGFPRLAGQNERYLIKQLQDFASGGRTSSVMKDKAAVLNESAILALARHYSRQQAGSTPTDDVQLSAVGQFVYERGNLYSGLPACLSCHGTQARGTAELPRLAGQHPRYLDEQLKQFAQRTRRNDNAIMNVIASRLSELERRAVTEYLGSLK